MTDSLNNDMTRAAIAVMTAWASAGPALATETIRNTVQDREAQGAMDVTAELLAGLVNLCGLLLVLRDAEHDVSPVGTLREIAAKPWNAGPAG
jgi:hypothetical protein